MAKRVTRGSTGRGSRGKCGGTDDVTAQVAVKVIVEPRDNRKRSDS